jgi:uncharacterized Zn finger protein
MKSKKDSIPEIKCSNCNGTHLVATHNNTGWYRCLNCGYYYDSNGKLITKKENEK